MAYTKRPALGQAAMAASEPVVIASNQSAVPVSATDLDIRNLTNTDVITAELSATDNAVLDIIDSAIDTMSAKFASGTVIGDVNLGATDNAVLDAMVATLGATTGAAVITDANGTIQQYLRGLIALDLVDNAVLDTIKTDTGTIAGFVSGGHGQVDVLTMPTVTVNAHAVTNAGTFVVQENGAALTALQLIDNAVSGAGFNITQLNGVNVLMGNGATGTGSQRVTIASDNTPFAIKTDQTTHGTTDKVAADATLIKGVAYSVGNGTADTGCQRVTIASDNTAFPVKVASGDIASGAIASGAIASGAIASGAIASGALASGSIATGAIVDALADDSAFGVASSRLFPSGLLADETSSDSVDEGDVGCPRMTLNRIALVTQRPSATGESDDIFFSIDLDESEEDIKATAGKIYGYYIYNNAATTRYVRFYNATAANTTVGTTAAIIVIPVPAGAAANCAFPDGLGFSTALCAAATTGVAANDTGAPGANDVVINVFYK
jgi:hypothetical protein